MNIDTLRAEFERQHAGRRLERHKLRGTYLSAPIAALWNQHKRTAEWVAAQIDPDASANRSLQMAYSEMKSSNQFLRESIAKLARATGATK